MRTITASRPITLWPYDSAPADYRAIVGRRAAPSSGITFLAVLPTDVDDATYQAFHHVLLTAAGDCTCLPLADGDVVCVGTFRRTPTVYETLGGAAGVDRMLTRWRERVQADRQLAARLDLPAVVRHRRGIGMFLCALLGGPQAYHGPNIREVRRHVTITGADFDRLLDHLGDAMRELDLEESTVVRAMQTLVPLKSMMIGEPESPRARTGLGS